MDIVSVTCEKCHKPRCSLSEPCHYCALAEKEGECEKLKFDLMMARKAVDTARANANGCPKYGMDTNQCKEPNCINCSEL
jgi:hypothetical protein